MCGGREGWQGCTILQMTWDKGASHHHLSTVMSLIIYISFWTAHFPEQYLLPHLQCVTATTVFFFSKPNLGNARVTDGVRMCFPLSLFEVNAMREQIFREMQKLGEFKKQKRICATYWRPCLNCKRTPDLFWNSSRNSIHTWDYNMSLSVPCVFPVWWLQLNLFVCLFVFIKYGTCVRMYVIAINESLNTLSNYLATYSL